MNTEKKSRDTTRFWGGLLIILGIIFLLNSMRLLDFGRFFSTFWPVVLILIGIWILLNRKESSSSSSDESRSAVFGDQNVKNSSDAVHLSNLFGDIKVEIDSKSFRGGNISGVFGDISVDLTQIDLQSGVNELTIHTIFGDIRIDPPKNVPFQVSGSGVLGDIKILNEKATGFSPKLSYQSSGYEVSSKKLRIYASQVFGDIKVF